jgi:hypothetical protein
MDAEEMQYNAEARAEAHRILDWFDAHPEVPMPYYLTANQEESFMESFEDVMALRKSIGGTMEKVFTEWSIGFRVMMTKDHYYTFTTNRNAVCEKVEVGTRVIPAREAEPEREVPEYKWVCPDSILAKFE